MHKDKILWSAILIVSLFLLIGYSLWGYVFFGNINFTPYGPGFYGRGIMNKGFSPYDNQQNNMSGQKMSIDQIRNAVEGYIQGYSEKLEMSDIFVFKDTDYYVSIQEKNTEKGEMELLVNPYTGAVYPEYGPNMMWNEKYGMHRRREYGMMGSGMMRGLGWNRNYQVDYDSKRIERKEAVEISDEYVKKNIDNDFSVLNEGHEFYGYYTFHVNKGDKIVGMLSVNYYTGDVWYHDWHGQLENIIEYDRE